MLLSRQKKDTAREIFSRIVEELTGRIETVKEFYGVAEAVGIEIAVYKIECLAKEYGIDLEKERIMNKEVKRTERGWIGHFCCADMCKFRRNTLLEYDDKKIIVSTVGSMEINGKVERVGLKRYYETMVWYGIADGAYIEIDADKPVEFESDWAIKEMNYKDDDNRANDMHEKVVAEITEKLLRSEL